MPKKYESKAVEVSSQRYVSCKDTAKLLGVNLRTIYREVERGELPATRVGTSLRISAKEIEKYLKRNRVRTVHQHVIYGS